MFVTQAHSFRQQARLAVTLAWVAGYTNILTVITCGTVTSHVSGTTSNLGHFVFAGEWATAAFMLFLLLAFFIGSMISGFCTEFARRRGWESIYVLPMILEATFLALFALILELHGVPASKTVDGGLWLMTGLASAAMGLQNATITRISSGLVRTTHVTGVLTDLGYETVLLWCWIFDRRKNTPPAPAQSLLRSIYHHPQGRHLALLGSILFTFALGAGLGTWAYETIPRFAMFPPVFFLAWIVFQDVSRPIAEIEESELWRRESGLDLPEALAIFHLRKDHDRHGRVHRMPNLTAWADRLAAGTRVVILDLEEVKQLDFNAIMELRALLGRLRERGCGLIIAGTNTYELGRRELLGAGVLQAENMCPDLELAIARGMALLADAGLVVPPPR
jgi:uncharacterized membrane protein YoaK (UPF0700 family)